MTPDEDLTPAEQRVSEFLRGLAAEAPRPVAELTTSVVRAARWQKTVRAPLRAVGGLAGALLEGVNLVLGGRRGTGR